MEAVRPPHRITPACAGNSLARFFLYFLLKDHPRVCGEQMAVTIENLEKAGSPPRVRGTAITEAEAANIFGITPACAGNSWLPGDSTTSSRDHPRVCGEQLDSTRAYRPLSGSPPRVRGTEPTYRLLASLPRITPACAGNRQKSVSLFSPLQDHPRVCGEQRDGLRLPGT